MIKYRDRIKDLLLLVGYVALIYLTLPVAPLASSFLLKFFSRSQLGILMNVFVVLAVIYPFLMFYRLTWQRKVWPLFGFTLILLIYAIILYLTPIAAEKIHLIEYGFLSLLSLRLVREAPSRIARYAFVVLIVAVVGCLDETIQWFLPNRVGEVRDAFLNIVSGLLGLALLWISGWEKEK